ncbi:MAG: ATP-binding protein [Kiritimatiellae bacterium]|nr:ATP-binding protein [Kiritimatiellia bacterium]
MKKLRIFVSSVQKELEIERVAVAGWVSSDQQLSELCDVVLFEKEPLSGKRISKPYLECLKSCQIYLLILDCEYGRPPEFSATHEEYRFARDNDLPMLIFIKGRNDGKREAKTKEFFDEIKTDGNTYRRFHDRMDLQSELEESLRFVLKDSFRAIISVEENRAAGVVETASTFEQQAMDVSAGQLDETVSENWLRAIKAVPEGQTLSDIERLNALRQKGLVRLEGNVFRTQASGLLFLGKDPAARFPQCRIFADAFRGAFSDSTPADQITLSGPSPVLVEQVWGFVQKNTRHPMRVVGLTRIALDEYPREAVRECIVNAIAHRNYEDSARQILVRLFSDRLEIMSPGVPMKPLTVAKIRKGNCPPCSRNPVLGQYLNHLRLMDQRGSGIGRMRTAMLNHGLSAPEYDLNEGYFLVTLKGPGDDLERLKVPAGTGVISGAVEAQLNERQRRMMAHALTAGFVTSGWCKKTLGVAYQTVYRDIQSLLDAKLIVQQGSGRSTRYIPSTGGQRE